MKTFLVIFALFAVACARPAEEETSSIEPIPILSQENENGFDGSFTNNFETGNGISIQQQGVLKAVEGSDELGQEISGSYSYTAPDGSLVKVDYIANENGFQPQGDVLPVAPESPPIPEGIARAIKFIEEHPPKEEEEEVIE